MQEKLDFTWPSQEEFFSCSSTQAWRPHLDPDVVKADSRPFSSTLSWFLGTAGFKNCVITQSSLWVSIGRGCRQWRVSHNPVGGFYDA